MTRNPIAGGLQPLRFPIVGIGSSAGGLAALQKFFSENLSNRGIAYVVVSHLDPDHHSLLPDILQKCTKLTICTIADNMRVQPNYIYVAPPKKRISILRGVLHVVDSDHNSSLTLPIDYFFRSLAQDQTKNAIGLILSGTGRDGSVGLKYIKEASGMTMAQSEESSSFKDMPRNAISTGMVDYILPPEEMPGKLFQFAAHQSQTPELPLFDKWEHNSNCINDIYEILQEHTDHDFSLYKKSTIYRRIARRMHLRKIESIKNYTNFLSNNAEEIEMLFRDLLIGVTYFFRNSESFDALKIAIFNVLAARGSEPSTFRAWVSGCSTGEEAYSIAILLYECLQAIDKPISAQIFSTDVDENAIAIARTGRYQSVISEHITPTRLKSYFTKDSTGTYQIKKTIREMVIFACQNSIKDPPFSNLDLISCRNLLIYLGPTLQEKLMFSFHYSLNPGGILFIGSSESVGRCHNLFYSIDEKNKIFQRNKEKPSIGRAILPTYTNSNAPAQPTNNDRHTPMLPEKYDTASIVEAILHESDHPPCVVIDREDNVIYIHGKISAYLEPAQGRVNMNIFHMARTELVPALLSGIKQVRETRQSVRLDNLTPKTDGSNLNLTVNIKPLVKHRSCADLIIVVFKNSLNSSAETKTKKTSRRHKNKDYKALEHELNRTKIDLKTKITELEARNEQLKFTNEELQTVNEELQSSNEELETSKEELQSLNEEASTTNAELQSRMNDVSKINDDMKNLLDSTEIATLFLDNDICVRRFTPRTRDIIPLIETDFGRALDNFSTKLIDVDLPTLCRDVLQDCLPKEYQVQSTNERYYTMRVRPYRTLNNAVDGVVITFENSTEKFTTKQALQKQNDLLKTIITNSSDFIFIVNDKKNIEIVSQPLCEFVGRSQSELIGQSFVSMLPPKDAPSYEHSDATDTKVVPDDATTIALKGVRGQSQVTLTRMALIDYAGNHDAILYMGKSPSRRSNS